MASFTWLLVLAIVSLAYAQRANLCLATNYKGSQVLYKPLQLYPSDCPNNASNCMAAVYNYNAKQFKSYAPSTLIPKVRESLVYMTQDANNVLDIVISSVTSYKNNIIKAIVNMTGAAPGVNTIVRDDPTGDTWNWDPITNSGNISWILQPKYTDGVVLGHIQIVDNFCFSVEFLPNWQGAITTISFLNGTTAHAQRVVSQPLVGNSVSSVFYEFCQFPSTMITKTDAQCGNLGSASATSLSGAATYVWMHNGAQVGTSSTINNLQPGTYTVTVTVNGCDATRTVTINSIGSPISATIQEVDQTREQSGSISLSVSGGNPPYTIKWMDSTGNVISIDTTSVSVPAGSYNLTITDGCNTVSYQITVNGPGACPAGSYIDGSGNCDVCLAGTYSSSANSNECTVCPPGYWNNVNNATSCNECPANTVTGGGSTTCSNCPMNTYSAAGSAVCTACAPGFTSGGGFGLILNRAVAAGSTGGTCTPCPAGTYRCDPNSLCSPCPAGTFSSQGAPTCTACDPGTSSSSGASSCDTCPANSYAASGSTCTSCPSGHAPAGSSSVIACM